MLSSSDDSAGSFFGDVFEVESYLRHQGSSFVNRFGCEFLLDRDARDGLVRSGRGS